MPKQRRKKENKTKQEVGVRKEKVWSISTKSHIGKGYKWCKEKLRGCRSEQLGNKSGEAAVARLVAGGPAGRKGKREQKRERGDYVWSLRSSKWGVKRREGSQWRQIKTREQYSLCSEKITWALASGIVCIMYNLHEAAAVILQEET